MRRSVAVLAAAGALLGAACSDDDDDGGTTTSTTSPEPSTTTAGEPTTTIPPADPVEDAAAAEAAAAAFMEAAFPAHLATLSAFRQGDPQSGEIEVTRPSEGGGPGQLASTLLLRRAGDTWAVVGAVHPVNSIGVPAIGDEVAAGPLVVSGDGRGFEATLVLQAVADDGTVAATALASAGALADAEPFEATLDLTGVPAGTELVIVLAGGTGLDGDPGEFAAARITVTG